MSLYIINHKIDNKLTTENQCKRVHGTHANYYPIKC